MIQEIQKNQENMKRLIVEPGASTHRSRGDVLNGGDHSYRFRADSYRIHSSRPGQSFLDALEEGEHKADPPSGDSSSNKVLPVIDEDPYKTNHGKTVPPSQNNNHLLHLHSESSQKSIHDKKNEQIDRLDLKINITEEEVKLNYILKEEDDHFISNAFLNSKPTGGKIKVVDGGCSSDRHPQQDTSDRKHTLDDDSNFNSREDGGSSDQECPGNFKKGLSRTKGSL